MLDKIVQRVLRIIKLDFTVFQEIEHDENANTEAAIIVAVASLLSAIGSGVSGGSFWIFLVTLVFGVALNWLLWSYIAMLVGTRLFKGEATFWEVARTLGYANAPRVLGLLAVIPCVGAIAALVGAILALVAGFFAMREALDLTTERTLITILISWVIVVVVNIVIGLVIGVGGSFI